MLWYHNETQYFHVNLKYTRNKENRLDYLGHEGVTFKYKVMWVKEETKKDKETLSEREGLKGLSVVTFSILSNLTLTILSLTAASTYFLSRKLRLRKNKFLLSKI